MTHLQSIVYTVDTFKDPDQCIDHLMRIEYEKVFIIVFGILSKTIVPPYSYYRSIGFY